LPNFPRPPGNVVLLGLRREDNIISNLSEEEDMRAQKPELSDRYLRPSSNISAKSPRHLPPLPHSRTTSGQFTAHDPARAHSRVTSDHFVQTGGSSASTRACNAKIHGMTKVLPETIAYAAVQVSLF
jgi:hypothetical protein